MLSGYDSDMSRILLSALVLAAASVACQSRADDPPVFDKRPYAEARRAAEDSGKWFIVKATAVWCQPCKQMDRTTWRDDKVVEWFEANGIAVSFDVDKERQRAEELKVQAMPTMIAFKDGKEFDRIVGYKSPAAFMSWLEGLARGEKSIEAVKRLAAPPAPGEAVDVRARLDLARTLAQTDEDAAAATEYAWLWTNMLAHQPSMYGVRLSFMAGEMERLAASSKDARGKFVVLRDEAAKALDGEKVERDHFVDWVTLNRVVGEQSRTLEWFDRVKAEPRWRELLASVGRELEQVLIAENRWADLGRLYPNPVRELEQEVEIRRLTDGAARGRVEGMDDGMQKQVQEIRDRILRERIGRLYAGLLAAERQDAVRDGPNEPAGGVKAPSAAFAARAFELDPAPAMRWALVGAALEAGEPHAQHMEWLAGAGEDEPMAKQLRRRLMAALDGK